MREVKDRIVQNLRAAKAQILGVPESARDVPAFDLELDGALEGEDLGAGVKALVSAELDHLLVVNSFALELQSLALESPRAKLRAVHERVLKLLDCPAADLDDALDQLAAQLELAQDENKLLLLEREHFFDRRMQGIALENDQLRLDNANLVQRCKEITALLE